MQITIIHDENNSSLKEHSFLRLAISSPCTASVVLKGLAAPGTICKGPRLIAIPGQWQTNDLANHAGIISHDNNTIKLSQVDQNEKWTVIRNGRYVTNVDNEMLSDVVDLQDTDILTVNVDPFLAAYCEKVRITPSSHVVGFRRWYCDSINQVAIPMTWPHYLFIRSNIVPGLLANNFLPLNFETLVLRAEKKSLTIKSFSVGGKVLDLNTADGLLKFATGMIDAIGNVPDGNIDMKTKFYGSVITGKNVNFGENVKVIGPAIVEDGVTIADDAVVNNSIIASGATIEVGEVVNNSIRTNSSCRVMQSEGVASAASFGRMPDFSETNFFKRMQINDVFRTWPLLSYPRFLKRIIDITASSVILTLFAPVFLIIAILIKSTSRGSVFYEAARQGKYGKEINCLKFRTMVENADQMQEKLRVVNEVDGPQFKIVHDPRVSTVGRFLRDTCLDEVPQFVNVLLGQMSIVGPRPSPESENSQCPSWRDARLSIRPGITGLWQISRTRCPSRDFQEWVHYDTDYVRNLSLKTDLWICFKTAMKLINDFVDQF
jgi:lipopolysaccharide/colanic/teichoic acid biosynthesis glycosyltransferase